MGDILEHLRTVQPAATKTLSYSMLLISLGLSNQLHLVHFSRLRHM